MKVDDPRAVATYLLCLLCLLASVRGLARAEQLPIKTYTTADGLAQDSINRIVRDSRGFLWFCTREGLSRFDGYQFTSFSTDQGLPHSWVNDLLETDRGVYWIATAAGVCRFNPAGSPLFVPYGLAGQEPSLGAIVLIEDQFGVCGAGPRLDFFDWTKARGTAGSCPSSWECRPKEKAIRSKRLLQTAEDRYGLALERVGFTGDGRTDASNITRAATASPQIELRRCSKIAVDEYGWERRTGCAGWSMRPIQTTWRLPAFTQ